MIQTIIGALLPVVVTLLLGFIAGWHKDFDGKQATILNRMVMLYALPLALFAGMAGIARDQVLSQAPLALAILIGMAGGYAVVFFVSFYLIERDPMTASLRALAIAEPAVPFVGVSVLGHLFGSASPIPISVASLVMNLVQVPVTLMLLSAGVNRSHARPSSDKLSVGSQILHAVREPVVWAPVAALVLVLFNIQFPAVVQSSLMLLGRATGGVALFASGIVLFSRRVAANLAVAVAVAARNILIPGAMWGLLLLLGVKPVITREAILTLAIPTSSLPVILAVQYQTAEQEMASTLFFSTVFSVLTMGGFIWLTA
jgi:malonate transporter and related proteins